MERTTSATPAAYDNGGPRAGREPVLAFQRELDDLLHRRITTLEGEAARLRGNAPEADLTIIEKLLSQTRSAAEQLWRAARSSALLPDAELSTLLDGYRATPGAERTRIDRARESVQAGGLTDPGQRLASSIIEVQEGLLAALERLLAAAGTFKDSAEHATPTAEFPLRDVVIPQATTGTISHVVILLHGIRTQGPWLEKVASVLRRTPELEAFPLRYGYFDILRFLFPFGTRSGPAKNVEQNIRMIRMQHPNATVSVIAHSFGTYTIGRVLYDHPDIRLDRLVLCGSVLPESFPWARISEQVRSRVLNECGTRDVWPLVAAGVTWGYGPTGTFGFGNFKVRDRFQPVPHSGFFDAGFVQDYWMPYLLFGHIIESPLETSRPTPPWWHSLLPHFKLAAIAALAILSLWGMS